MEDDTAPEEYAEHVSSDMDMREMITVMCDLHGESKVPQELAVEVAVLNGVERDVATRRIREFISTVEIVELEGGYVQDRAHFDEGFE